MDPLFSLFSDVDNFIELSHIKGYIDIYNKYHLSFDVYDFQGRSILHRICEQLIRYDRFLSSDPQSNKTFSEYLSGFQVLMLDILKTGLSPFDKNYVYEDGSQGLSPIEILGTKYGYFIPDAYKHQYDIIRNLVLERKYSQIEMMISEQPESLNYFKLYNYQG